MQPAFSLVPCGGRVSRGDSVVLCSFATGITASGVFIVTLLLFGFRVLERGLGLISGFIRNSGLSRSYGWGRDPYWVLLLKPELFDFCLEPGNG